MTPEREAVRAAPPRQPVTAAPRRPDDLSGEVKWPDLLLGSILAAAAIAYLGLLPLDTLTPPDEAHALHQAKRLGNGEVLYRDLFDLVTPLWTYLMAGLFRLFGTTLATARMGVAVIHGAAILMVFLLCRRLGVRRELAALAATAYLVLCQPVYPVANRHWLESLLCLLLLFWCVRQRGSRRGTFVAGVLVGLLIANHQQRGVSMGLAVALWIVVDTLLAARYDRRRGDSLWSAAAALAAGVLAVVALMFAVVIAPAGLQPVWYALVVHPLTHYHGTVRAPWGTAGAHTALTTFPLLLKYLPVVLVPLGTRVLVLVWRRQRGEEARRLALLFIFCAFAALSIVYYPDLAHLAFVAPIFFVAGAESAEWLLRLLPPRWAAIAARVALILFTAASALWLSQRWQAEHGLRRMTRATAFGDVELLPMMAQRYDALDRLLRDAPSRSLYVHPISFFTYLLLDARNPTRFEFMHAGSYNSAEQAQEVIDALRSQKVPYVFFSMRRLRPGDPIVAFVEQNYEPLVDFPGVWRRKQSE